MITGKSKLTEDDINIIREPDNPLNHGDDRGYYLEIYKSTKEEAESLKQQILENQEKAEKYEKFFVCTCIEKQDGCDICNGSYPKNNLKTLEQQIKELQESLEFWKKSHKNHDETAKQLFKENQSLKEKLEKIESNINIIIDKYTRSRSKDFHCSVCGFDLPKFKSIMEKQ
jgi:DNA repair exonuclease SbcCD ATPase subunit